MFIKKFLATIGCLVVAASGSFASNGATAPNSKLHPDLADAAKYYSSQHSQSAKTLAANISAYAKEHRFTMQNAKVLVEIFLADTSAKYIRHLATFGIVHDRGYGRLNNRLQAFVPLNKLAALAAEKKINWIQPPGHPHADVTSEGVAKTYADTYQNHSPAWDGTGVKVAIVDLGFATYQSKLGTELPAAVTAVSFRSDGDITGGNQPHGTACAETVHDMAPGAQLYLLNFGTLTELTNAVNYCISNGIKVISHSIGWTNVSFYDGTGDLKTIVDNATSAGIVWCNSSGNEQNRHWDGTFSDPDANGWENFSGADEDININLTSGGGCTLELTWDQWPIASSDYDLYLYRDVSGSLVQVAASTVTQNGTQPPTEDLYYTPSQTGLYHIKIKKKTGAATRLALFCYEYDFAEYNVGARSLMDPSPVVNAFAVGAVNVSNDVLENFSSLGPSESNLSKPDISAPDGTSNSVYGTFYGTSAACPHTAGAAALLLNQNPARTVAQVKTILIQNALDLGVTGVDDSYGAGRLRMPDITAPGVPQVTSSTHNPNTWSGNNSVTVSWPAVTDSWSGVAGYSYVWDQTAGTVPDSIVETTATSLTTTLTDAGDWYFHVSSVDNAGNKSAAAQFGPVKVDATPPVVPTLLTALPLPGAWSNRDSITASWSDTDVTSGVAGYVAVIDHNAQHAVTTGLTAPATKLSAAVGEGVWYMHVASRDSAGNWSPTLDIGPYRIDRTPPRTPAFTTVQPTARSWTNNRHAAAFWISLDTLSGIMQYFWDWDKLVTTTVFNDSGMATGSNSPVLNDSRQWMFHVIAMDSAGNLSNRADAGPFYIDSTPPKNPTSIITYPPISTWSGLDSITIRYTGQTDSMSGVMAIDYVVDTSFNASDKIFAAKLSGTFTTPALSDGANWHVYLRVVDSAGNFSADTTLGPFMIDTHTPEGASINFSSIAKGNWVNSANRDSVHWLVNPNDTSGTSGIRGYSWLWSLDSTVVPDTIIDGSFTDAIDSLADGIWFFNLRTDNSAGVWQTGASTYGPIMIDRTPPTGIITINGGATQTTDTIVIVRVYGQDATSGADSCIVTHDGSSLALPLKLNEADINWSLANQGGAASAGWHVISARIRDSAGNWSANFSDSIFYNPLTVNEPAAVANAFAISVFPNPVTSENIFTIHNTDAFNGAVRVSLVDALGRTVLQRSFENNSATIAMPLDAPVAAGTYECRVEDVHHTSTSLVTVMR